MYVGILCRQSLAKIIAENLWEGLMPRVLDNVASQIVSCCGNY